MTARKILRNVGSNSLGYVVNVAVSIVLSPFILKSLGPAVAGVWTLVVSFVGYYGLLDLGIRSAVGHYVATYHARRDEAQVNRTLSTAMAMMLVVGAIAATLTLVAAFQLPGWYVRFNELRAASGAKEETIAELLRDPGRLRTVILLMGFSFAINFPMVIYSTVIYSVQRIDLQNAIGIGQVLLRALLTWWVLRAGHGIVGLAAVVVGTNALGWFAAMICAHRVLPSLSVSATRGDRASSRDLLSYGSYNVLVNVGDTVLLYTSGFVIMFALQDETAVYYYSIPANQLVPYFMSIVQAVTWSFTPHFTGRWATGALDDVRRLLDAGSRGVVMLASLIAGGLWFFGRDFVRLWMGVKFYGDGNESYFAASMTCLAILTAATLVRASQSCGRQALFAMREVRYLGLLTLCEAVANVLLSVLLVRRFGLPGIAAATLIPVIVTQGFVLPMHLMRELDCDWRPFWLGLLRASVPIVATMALIDRLLGPRLAASSWPTFLVRAAVVAVPALVAGLLCGTTADERRSLVRQLTGARTSGSSP